MTSDNHHQANDNVEAALKQKDWWGPLLGPADTEKDSQASVVIICFSLPSCS